MKTNQGRSTTFTILLHYLLLKNNFDLYISFILFFIVFFYICFNKYFLDTFLYMRKHAASQAEISCLENFGWTFPQHAIGTREGRGGMAKWSVFLYLNWLTISSRWSHRLSAVWGAYLPPPGISQILIGLEKWNLLWYSILWSIFL